MAVQFGSKRILSLAAFAAGLILLTPRAGITQTVPTFNLSTAPTLVADNGPSEEVGQIALAAAAICSAGVEPDGFCVSGAGTLHATFSPAGVIANNLANGIQICEQIGGAGTCNSAGSYLSGSISVVANSISIGVKAGADLAAGDQIIISGVRLNMTQSCPSGCAGLEIFVIMTASPSITAGYSPTSQVVARAFKSQSAIKSISGNGQSATAGTPLASPFVVEVTAPMGGPGAGVAVTFAVVSGGGSLSATDVITGGDGRASTTLILGSNRGQNTVSASSAAIPGSPVTFSAIGILDISLESGDNQTGLVGTALANPLVVKATGYLNVPVAGIPIDFAITAGGGSFSTPSQITTDAQGLASATLTLGVAPGTITVEATSVNVPGHIVSFTANAVTSIPTAIALLSGNDQSGVVGHSVDPFVVKVTDTEGKSSSGVAVEFAITFGGGSLSASQVVTDAQGQASTILTLGPEPGTNTITATAEGLTGSPITFTATAVLPEPTPSLNSGGVVNGGSFRPASEPNGAVAPGAIVSLFGSNLASETLFASEVPLATSLGETSVTFDGTAAPLFVASGGQINAQVPFELLPGEVQVQVKRGGETSDTQAVTVAAVSPGIFATNQQGTGQGAVLIANTAIFAAPSGSIPGQETRPANRLEFISIYCTGLGDVTNRPASGEPPSGGELSVTMETPTVTIGGIEVQPSFSGLTGFVGLYQVNVQVPSNAPTGDAVNVVITIGGVTSNTVTIAAQ